MITRIMTIRSCLTPVISVRDANIRNFWLSTFACSDIEYVFGYPIVRMIAHVIGKEAMRRAMHEYLVAHRYATATHEMLIEALENASRGLIESRRPCVLQSIDNKTLCGDLTLRQFLNEFFWKRSYPEVTVKASSEANSGKRLTFEQQPWNETLEKTRWNIPLFVSGESEIFWLLKNNSICHKHRLSDGIVVANNAIVNYENRAFIRLAFDESDADWYFGRNASGFSGIEVTTLISQAYTRFATGFSQSCS